MLTLDVSRELGCPTGGAQGATIAGRGDLSLFCPCHSGTKRNDLPRSGPTCIEIAEVSEQLAESIWGTVGLSRRRSRVRVSSLPPLKDLITGCYPDRLTPCFFFSAENALILLSLLSPDSSRAFFAFRIETKISVPP